MVSLADRCLSCIINNADSYGSFASLPSESCEAILLLMKGKVSMTHELLCKFGDSYVTSLDISNESSLDYTQFMEFLAKSPSASTIHTLNVAYSEFDDDDMDLLQHFPNLSVLNVSHCDSLTGASFSALGSLTSLNLRGCTSIDGNSLSVVAERCPRLQTLILSKCTQLEDQHLEPLSSLSLLSSLKLDHCDAITAAGLTHVAALAQLRVLSASHIPSLRHAGACKELERLTNLKFLDLSYCNITDESFPPASLRALSALTHLEINMNQLSSQFTESISVCLLDLRVLELGHSSHLQRDNIICLKRLPNLEIMHLTNGRRDRLRLSFDHNTLKKLTLPVPIPLNTPTTATELALSRIPAAIPTAPDDMSRPIVLLGEDEQFQARLVKTVLERKNFVVEIASDGITAYNMYKESHKTYALVMMDIFLPKMDGLQSIRLIRKFEADNKSKHTPVIICSGNPQMKTKQGNYLEESGGDMFIPKPFPKSLVGLIQTMTGAKA